jgi:hypothetical protein
MGLTTRLKINMARNCGKGVGFLNGELGSYCVQVLGDLGMVIVCDVVPGIAK